MPDPEIRVSPVVAGTPEKPQPQSKIKKLTQHLRRQKPREVLEDAASDPRLETAEPNSLPEIQDLTFSGFDNYDAMVDELGKEDPAWKTILEQARAYKTWDQKKADAEYHPKPVSAAEKLRRQGLAVQARLHGVKDIKKFNDLVEYLESTVEMKDSVWVSLPKDASEDVRKRQQERWEAKGYPKVDFNDYDEKHLSLVAERDVPLRIVKNQIDFLKPFLSESANPIQVLEDLKKMGLRIDEYTLRNKTDMKQLGDFLSHPNAESVIKVASKIEHWNRKWFPGGYYAYSEPVTEDTSNLGYLLRVAQAPEILTNEAATKINLLSQAIRQSVGAQNIDGFDKITASSDLLTLASIVGQMDRSDWNVSQIAQVTNILYLGESGLLPEILDLREKGLVVGEKPIDSLFDGEHYYEMDQIREKAIVAIRETLSAPEVVDFLQDKEMQDFFVSFAEATGHLVKRSNMQPLALLREEGQDMMDDALYAARLLYGKTKYPPNTDLIERLVHDGRVLKTLKDPDFPGFLYDLQDKAGVVVSYNGDNLFDDRYGRDGNSIIELFNNVSAREAFSQDAVLAVVQAFHRGGIPVAYSEPDYYIDIAKNPYAVEVINTLQDLKCVFGNSSQANLPDKADFIKNLNDSEARARITSEEFKQLSTNIQESFRYTLTPGGIEEMLRIYDNKALQSELFKPENVDFIRRIRPYATYDLDSLEVMIEQDELHREVLIELLDTFKYSHNFNLSGQELLDKLVLDPELRSKLFSNQAKKVFQDLKAETYYSFNLEDAEVIANASPNFPDLVHDLKEKYQYHFIRIDMPALLAIDVNRESYDVLLSSLTSAGYKFNGYDIFKIGQLVAHADEVSHLIPVLSNVMINYGLSGDGKSRGAGAYKFRVEDVPHLLSLVPFTDKLPDMMRDLNQGFGYLFKIADTDHLVDFLAQDISADRLSQLKQVYDRNKEYLDMSPATIKIADIVNLQYVEQIEDFMETIPKGERASLIEVYINSFDSQSTISPDERALLLESYKKISETYTAFSFARADQLKKVETSTFGKALADVIPAGAGRNRILLDYACFSERLEVNKIELILESLKSVDVGDRLPQLMEYLRWLPDKQVSPQDTLATLDVKYKQTLDNLREGFSKIFPNAGQIRFSPQDQHGLTERLNDIAGRFDFPSRTVNIEGIEYLNLPIDFIKEFNSLKRQDPQAQFIPELSAYLIREIGKKSTAYTMEDMMLSQIGETEDMTGRRRDRYAAEQLLEVMENNIEASLLTWTTAIDYQKAKPNSPLFIIANERTGPADLAAEYLPKEFADRFKILQTVDYDTFYSWFQGNESFVGELYDRFKNGEDVRKEIPNEIRSLLGGDDRKLIPIYRLKVPSSLNAAATEPPGVETVLSFLKFSSILGGRTLFMDESTRSAPRSIECLYNVVNRRQEVLGGAEIRLFGKIKGVEGQNRTQLDEVRRPDSHMEVAFIDPWHSQIKSVTDDSLGFVPEVTGNGIVEVITPSFTSVSPYGIDTIQDLWKQMISQEVAVRFDGFNESGGLRKSRAEFRRAVDRGQEIITQNELKDMAFAKPFKALAIDLDGTVGSSGKYNSQVLERIKQLAESNIDVVIGTARSLINHTEYDGSVSTFIEQLGDLSDKQKSHIHLATENAAVITTLSDMQTPKEAHLMSDQLAQSVDSMIQKMLPDVRIYKEQGSIVLRDFSLDMKEDIIRRLALEAEKNGLPCSVTTESRRSINIRVVEASKRNILNWLEQRGLNVDDIAKIGDSPAGNDRPMFWGRGSFNVGETVGVGTLWTIDMNEYGGGSAETELLLERLQFAGV